MSKYYLVDELENDNMCFESIKDVKESADEFGLNFDELIIYETEMKPLKMDAKYHVEIEIDRGEFGEIFDIDYIPEEKIQELQNFLDKWCSEINTNTYERDKKLSIEEVYKRLSEENE